MILLKPTIRVNRLYVEKEGRSVMDIAFHAGLNIISGENSSGKTTAVRFLAFAMGAEAINFNKIAQVCDAVLVEIVANDTVVTLRRMIVAQAMPPLAIYWGDLGQALCANISSWQQYPFKRSELKESFSQVLFRLLGVPELRGEGGSNITMHQLMRLIYSDQETPSTDIFRFDRFDRAITRAAVGDYLLGVDSSELYELKLQETAVEKEASNLRGSIKTIYNTFGHSGTNVSLDFIDQRVQSLDGELRVLHARLENLNNETAKPSARKEDVALRAKLNTVHAKLSSLKQSKLDLESEISDSQFFLRELEERLSSLEESYVAEAYLGTAIFSSCPSCFSKLESATTNGEVCALCKSPVAADAARSQLARMRNELALQLKESETIRVQQLEQLDSIVREIPALEAELKYLEKEYKRNQVNWRSPDLILTESISKEIGAKEQEIKNALELKKLADLLDALARKLSTAESQLKWLEGRIAAVEYEQINRRSDAYLSVANNLKIILKEDFARQLEFARANDIEIDFAANRITIDGQTQFSASSMVFLRHAFHFALLLSSLEKQYFRYPRLLIIDGIEDGGMEVNRSYNFQKIIAKYSEKATAAHQIIMTTTSVAPELDEAKYLVGRKFTHIEKSIDIQ